MQQSRETLAHRMYTEVKPNRAAKYDEILEMLAKRNDLAGIERAEQNRMAVEASEFATTGANPVTALVAHCSDSLLEALRTASWGGTR